MFAFSLPDIVFISFVCSFRHSKNDLNPVWNSCFLVAIPVSVPAIVKIDVYDSDKGTMVDGGDDFLGRAQFDLAAIAGRSEGWNEITLPLTGSSESYAAKGTLTLSARYYKQSQLTIVSGSNLRNADGFFGKSDPFARVAGLISATHVWGETKTVRDNLNPTWGETYPLDLISLLPLGGKLLPLTIEVRDEDDKKRGSSDEDLLGTAQVTHTATITYLSIWSHCYF
jgi:Ca2+-dependent lipid-binding protein